MNCLESNSIWIDETWDKIEKKIAVTSQSIKDHLPYRVVGDKYDNNTQDDWIFAWTNSFYCGILWLMYKKTKNEYYKQMARSIEDKLDAALYGYERLSHDTGFLWLLSAVEDFRQTGEPNSRLRGLRAASYLASRYNIKTGFIKAWNMPGKEGWSIIDTMMNMPILYWASEQLGDKRFAYVAQAHSDKTLENFIRQDGSVRHVVEYDTETGEFIQEHGGQGYGEGSSWTRGQGWAIYGFVQGYSLSGDERYLMAAKRVANYFITCLSNEDTYVPKCDFRQGNEVEVRDASAGAIAACGMIEIAKALKGSEGEMYLNAAIRILKDIDRFCGLWDTDCEALIGNVTHAYHDESSRNTSIIYGDFYFAEAICKLCELKEYKNGD